MANSAEIHAEIKRAVESGEPYSLEGLDHLLEDWEATWERCFAGRSPDEFESDQAVENAGREAERLGDIEISDEDRAELVRYWTYHHQREALQELGLHRVD